MTRTYTRRSYDVVAYIYRAEILCPPCTLRTVEAATGTEASDPGWGIAIPLGTIAHNLGIDPEDETSYDSDDFPKVVFADQVDEDERCNQCGGRI